MSRCIVAGCLTIASACTACLKPAVPDADLGSRAVAELVIPPQVIGQATGREGPPVEVTIIGSSSASARRSVRTDTPR